MRPVLRLELHALALVSEVSRCLLQQFSAALPRPCSPAGVSRERPNAGAIWAADCWHLQWPGPGGFSWARPMAWIVIIVITIINNRNNHANHTNHNDRDKRNRQLELSLKSDAGDGDCAGFSPNGFPDPQLRFCLAPAPWC